MHARIDFFHFNFEPPPHLPVNTLQQKWKLSSAPLFVAKALHAQPLDNIYFANGISPITLIHDASI